MDRDDFIMYNAQLTGTIFKRDAKHVYKILKEFTNGTQAEDWMKRKSYGRIAMISLKTIMTVRLKAKGKWLSRK